MNEPLWTPDPERIRGSNMHAFMAAVERDWGCAVTDYAALWRWSVAEREKFWRSVRDFCGARAQTWGDELLVNGDAMPGARWFPGARLNFAENLLQRSDATEAMVFWGENRVKRRMTYRELYDLVSRLAQVLRAAGVELLHARISSDLDPFRSATPDHTPPAARQPRTPPQLAIPRPDTIGFQPVSSVPHPLQGSIGVSPVNRPGARPSPGEHRRLAGRWDGRPTASAVWDPNDPPRSGRSPCRL